jgi:hypothetical protein
MAARGLGRLATQANAITAARRNLQKAGEHGGVLEEHCADDERQAR